MLGASNEYNRELYDKIVYGFSSFFATFKSLLSFLSLLLSGPTALWISGIKMQ